MTSGLQRRLGLYSVFTVSIGAMIGSGIFVLPGLAFEVGGPSVILAFALAGLIVVPAALAQSEMATAMPRAGGAYLYVDLAMGPLMGTIAGLGVWLSLVFKSAFALDGLGLYLGLFSTLDPLMMGLLIGGVLLALNLAGVRQSGWLQGVLVTVVFGVLLLFVGGGATFVEREHFHPFATAGLEGVLRTAGIVFVAYAGVTKVASVAEEVEAPARTLPVAIMSSLLVMMFLYPTVTYVMVGITPPEMLSGNLTPLATASSQIFGAAVVNLVAVVGVVALVSMANAGLLASSRYPFAMARRRLVPALFARIENRSAAPRPSLLVTGALLLGLVAFVPVFELAKLASAFQLLVLVMINLAQLAFRSSNLWWYRPKFTAPGYPWVPLLGIASCLVLITVLGWDALIGAAVIIAVGALWYQVYGRSRAIKESVFRESVRQQGTTRLLKQTEAALAVPGRRIAVVSNGGDGDLQRIARALAGSRAADDDMPTLSPEGDLEEGVRPVDPDLVVGALEGSDTRHEPHLPDDRDAVLLEGRHPGTIDRIGVLGSGGPYDVLKITVAAKLAAQEGATIRFIHVLDPNASRAQVRSLESFHASVGDLCEVPTESHVRQSEDLLGELTMAMDDADLAVIGAPRGRHLFNDLIDRIVRRAPVPVLLVRPADRDEPTSLRTVLDRMMARGLTRGDALHDGGGQVTGPAEP
ncbi:MAG: amino acid permease [Actinomycetota bacterium]